jgi:hypothetical protein
VKQIAYRTSSPSRAFELEVERPGPASSFQLIGRLVALMRQPLNNASTDGREKKEEFYAARNR